MLDCRSIDHVVLCRYHRPGTVDSVPVGILIGRDTDEHTNGADKMTGDIAMHKQTVSPFVIGEDLAGASIDINENSRGMQITPDSIDRQRQLYLFLCFLDALLCRFESGSEDTLCFILIGIVSIDYLIGIFNFVCRCSSGTHRTSIALPLVIAAEQPALCPVELRLRVTVFIHLVVLLLHI